MRQQGAIYPSSSGLRGLCSGKEIGTGRGKGSGRGNIDDRYDFVYDPQLQTLMCIQQHASLEKVFDELFRDFRVGEQDIPYSLPHQGSIVHDV